MKNVIVLLLCGLTGTAHAQYLKIDNGILFNSFSNKKDLPILSSVVSSYSAQVGADYLERNWFSLSSQVGYMRTSGREKNPFLLQPEFNNITERKEYITINTTFRPHLKASASTLFAGIGPTVGIPIGDKNFRSSLYKGYRYNRLRVGGKAELGITEDIKKFRFGLVGGYLFDLSPVAESEFLSLYNNAFSVMITTGYCFR